MTSTYRKIMTTLFIQLFLLLLTDIFLPCGSSSNTDRVDETFHVKPGSGTGDFQTQLGDYTCVFTYAAQGGTKEEWKMNVEFLDGGSAIVCVVDRGTSSSYLFFEHFKLALSGPGVSVTEVEAKNTQRDNKYLQKEEYSVDKNSISSTSGKFKNHIEYVAVFSPLPKGEL